MVKLLPVLYLILLLFIFPVSSYSQITLTEIMFDPDESEYYYEFIEIYNQSDKDSIRIVNYKISDGNDFDTIVNIGPSEFLKPHQFGIILDPGYFEHTPVYDSLIPKNALILSIDGSTFGSSGLSNTEPEIISLIDPHDKIESRYQYSIDNEPGYSDEKIILTQPNIHSNWRNSLSLHGSPGKINSVSPLAYDLSISLTLEPLDQNERRFIPVITVRNLGLSSASDFDITIFKDLFAPDNILFHQSYHNSIAPFDSLFLQTNDLTLNSGVHYFYASLEYSQDLNPENNQCKYCIDVAFKKHDLVVNEFMYAPLSGDPEWIEIYNPSPNDSININRWQFSDSNSQNRILICDTSFYIQPKGYYVLAQSSKIISIFPSIDCPVFTFPKTFPVLNNTFDDIILYDMTSTIIDNVSFSSEWGYKQGVSLEKVNANSFHNDNLNWKLNSDNSGASPGTRNSVSPKDIDVAIVDFSYELNDFIEGNLPSAICYITIKNVGLLPVKDFYLNIYDDLNHDSLSQDSELLHESFPLEITLHKYDSTIYHTDPLNFRSGIVQLIIESICSQDQNLLNNQIFVSIHIPFICNQIVINEIMYTPNTNNPEWIELFNRSQINIDIQKWSVSNSDSAKKITLSKIPYLLTPDEYLIVSNDTLNLTNHPQFKEPHMLVLKQMPSLTNTNGEVYIYDMTHTIIDHVSYSKYSGGDKAISLERFNPDVSSDDPANWSSCTDNYGSTPGFQNSIFIQSSHTNTTLHVSPNPFSPDSDGFEDVTVIQYQLQTRLARLNIRIFDCKGRLVRFLCNNDPSGSDGSVIWDGKNDNDEMCRMGIYIIHFMAINEQAAKLMEKTTTVVLANRL